MTRESTLLSFIAQHHTVGLEDVATDALSFILSRSTSARRALSEFLGMNKGHCLSQRRSPGRQMRKEPYLTWLA